MKTEIKTNVLIAVILLSGFLASILIFFTIGGRAMRLEYSRERIDRTKELSALFADAVLGNDYDFITNSISSVGSQQHIMRAVMYDVGNRVMASSEKGRGGTIFKEEGGGDISKFKEPVSVFEYFDTATSKHVYRVSVPIVVTDKKWATLSVTYDRTSFVQVLDGLMFKQISAGLIVFAICLVLTLIVVKSPKTDEIRKDSFNHFDAFALPSLNYNTIIALKGSTDRTRLSEAENKIVELVTQDMQVQHVVEKSPFEEIVSFEIVSELVTAGIIEIKDKGNFTVELKSLIAD